MTHLLICTNAVAVERVWPGAHLNYLSPREMLSSKQPSIYLLWRKLTGHLRVSIAAVEAVKYFEVEKFTSVTKKYVMYVNCEMARNAAARRTDKNESSMDCWKMVTHLSTCGTRTGHERALSKNFCCAIDALSSHYSTPAFPTGSVTGSFTFWNERQRRAAVWLHRIL